MKKLSLLMALTMLACGAALLPTTANAQDEKQAEFERTWYDVCFIKKPTDEDKCFQLSKELVEKYPKSSYFKNAQTKVDAYVKSKAWKQAWEKFQAALKAYYAAPDAAKLDQLFSAGEEVLKIQPDQQYTIAQLAIAGAHGSIGQIYKNLDKVKGYGEQALKAFEPAKAPEGWQQPDWDSLREIVMAQVNQFMGWHLIETKGDQEKALEYLTKAIQVKGKDGAGWKDPNNYWLRSNVYSAQYPVLRAEYDKLTDEQKNGEQGKEILKKVNELLDTKLIPEYARVLATATKPEAKSIYDAAKPLFDTYWKFRTDAPEKAADYVKNFASDPTVAAPPIPAKAETADNASSLAAPTVGASNVKLSSGTSGVAPGGAKNGNGRNGKAATKGKPSPKSKKGRRG